MQQRVAYQGAPGAYSEGAARKAVPGGEPLPCEQFEVAFQALTQWLADRAVLPIENSVGGSIHTVYDLLMRCGARSVSPFATNCGSLCWRRRGARCSTKGCGAAVVLLPVFSCSWNLVVAASFQGFGQLHDPLLAPACAGTGCTSWAR